MSDLVTRAADFAKAAHESINQRRKYSDQPYIVHPAAVAEIVKSVTNDPVVLAAAMYSLLAHPSARCSRALCPLPHDTVAKGVMAVDFQEGNQAPVRMKRLKYYPGLARKLDLPVAWRYRRGYIMDHNGNLLYTALVR